LEAEFITSAVRPEQFPPEGPPEIAFLGRSNVGKSSLLNQLLEGRHLAQTSGTPGCTQLVNFYSVERKFHFVDLPGYGYARVPQALRRGWKGLVEAYLTRRSTLKLSILLLDARRGWMEQDLELKRWLEFHKRRHLVVATKMDKLNRREQNRGMAAIREHCSECELLPFSALTGQGAREIWQAIWKTQNSR
jgi:GTP-binding protein